MRLKIFKIIIYIVAILVILFMVTMLIPIKFCLSSIPSNSNEDFFIIKYSRDKVAWLIIGDKNGLFSDEITQERRIRPTEKGFGIGKTLSVDIYMQGDATNFIVYGTATIDEFWDEKYYGETGNAILYTIDCTGWDIWGKIRTMNSIRNMFPKNYLNIYDYRWFDVLRDKLFWYLDGETNF